MSGILNDDILKVGLILLASVLVGLSCTPSLRAGEPDAQPTTNFGTQQPPPPAQQVQPEQKSTKTKLEPRDLLPSMLTPKPGTGSAAREESLLTRDRAQLRRIERGNTRINQKMRQLDYSIQKMRSDVNRTLRIRRQRY